MSERRLNVLEMWVVYEHPQDRPEMFVARRFEVGAGVIEPKEMVEAATLEAVRGKIPQRGRYERVPRMVGDEPHIVEVWL